MTSLGILFSSNTKAINLTIFLYGYSCVIYVGFIWQSANKQTKHNKSNFKYICWQIIYYTGYVVRILGVSNLGSWSVRRRVLFFRVCRLFVLRFTESWLRGQADVELFLSLTTVQFLIQYFHIHALNCMYKVITKLIQHA